MKGVNVYTPDSNMMSNIYKFFLLRIQPKKDFSALDEILCTFHKLLNGLDNNNVVSTQNMPCVGSFRRLIGSRGARELIMRS